MLCLIYRTFVQHIEIPESMVEEGDFDPESEELAEPVRAKYMDYLLASGQLPPPEPEQEYLEEREISIL